MSPFLKDYLRRWWWMIVIVALGQFAMMDSSRAQRMAPVLSLFAGVIPLLIDGARGFMRPVLQMPIGRPELAIRIWQLVVALPGVLTLVVVLAGHLIFGTPRSPIFPDWTAPFFCGFMALVTNGVMFATFSGMRPGRPKAAQQALVFFHMAVVFTCVLGPILSVHLLEDPLWLVLTYGVAAVSTWVGWRHRETMVSGSGQRPLAQLADQTAAIPRTHPCAPKGHGGWEYLFRNTAKMYAIWAVILGIMMWLYGYVLSAMASGLGRPMQSNFFSAENPGAIVMWLMVVAVAMRPVFQPRVLRMLPIRPAVMAALMLGMPLLASFVTMGLYSGVTWLFSANPSFDLVWNRTSQLLVFFLVGIPVILRWGMSMASLAIFFASFMVFVGLSSQYQNLVPAIALLPSACVSYWMIHRLLTRSSAPYRSRPTLPGYMR